MELSSGSDDDLLGINDDPIPIRHSKCQHVPASDEEWITVNGKRPSLPSMPASSPQKNFDDRTKKYQTMRPLSEVKGYVVNVHDALNFDIDLELSPDVEQNYRQVKKDEYDYQDLGPEFLRTADMKMMVTCERHRGTAYRCHVRGVGSRPPESGEDKWKINNMSIDIDGLIDRADRWVLCRIGDIDVYGRILVDLTILTPSENIDLRDYLLSNQQDENNPLFFDYKRHYDRGNRRNHP